MCVATVVLFLAPLSSLAAWVNYSDIRVAPQWQVQQGPQDQSALLLDPVTLHKGLVNMGERALYQRAMCEVLREQTSGPVKGLCLYVVVLGGSFSIGSSFKTKHPDVPHGKKDAWPSLLERLLDRAYPRKGGSVPAMDIVPHF